MQDSDWKPLETIANKAIKEKQAFERLVMSKTDLLEMFKYSKYKVHFIQDKVPDGTDTTVYRCGPLIDLCLGPHVPNTGRIKAFAIMKVGTPLAARASWLTAADRIPQPTGWEARTTSRCSASPESPSPTRS